MYNNNSSCNGGSGGGGDGPSNLSVFVQSQKGSCTTQPLDASFLSAASTSHFLGNYSLSLFTVAALNMLLVALKLFVVCSL